MSSSAPKSTLTPRRWKRGSCPETAGAMKSPVASQAVAIEKMPSCVCHVRVTA